MDSSESSRPAGERGRTRQQATIGGVLAWLGATLPGALSYHRTQIPAPWWVLVLVVLVCFVLVSGASFAGVSVRLARVLVLVGALSALGATALWGVDQTTPVMLVLMAGAGAWVLPTGALVGLIVVQSLALAVLQARFSTSAVWSLVYAALMGFAALMVSVAKRAGEAVDEANRISIELGRANGRLRIANTELEAAQARLAEASRSEERLRISRDLHDGVGNQLTALSLTLDLLGRQVTGEAAEHVDEAKVLAAGLLRDTRRVVSQLRDARVSIRDEIARLARSLPRPHTSLDLAEDLDDIPTAVGEALVRVIQESLTNAARHSTAANAWVVVERAHGQVTFDVRDDGADAGQVVPGNGLTGMSERVALLGGRIAWSSTPAGGFRIHGTIPEGPAGSGPQPPDARDLPEGTGGGGSPAPAPLHAAPASELA